MCAQCFGDGNEKNEFMMILYKHGITNMGIVHTIICFVQRESC